MSQYTDKINQIAEDFAEIEYYETLSALEARDGMMIVHYNHGGKKIEFHRDSSYEGTKGKAGDVIILPPLDQQYVALKEKYDSGETFQQTLARWWKKFKKITYPGRMFGD